jgi:hypothetical protein
MQYDYMTSKVTSWSVQTWFKPKPPAQAVNVAAVFVPAFPMSSVILMGWIQFGRFNEWREVHGSIFFSRFGFRVWVSADNILLQDKY